MDGEKKCDEDKRGLNDEERRMTVPSRTDQATCGCDCHKDTTGYYWESKTCCKCKSDSTAKARENARNLFPSGGFSQNTLDYLAAALEAEYMRGCVDALHNSPIYEEGYRRGLEEMLEYAQHDQDCILSFWHAGEPRPDGSYWVQYKDTWYQSRPVDQTPKCECGLDALAERIRGLVK